jgi:hypothetical protein
MSEEEAEKLRKKAIKKGEELIQKIDKELKKRG